MIVKKDFRPQSLAKKKTKTLCQNHPSKLNDRNIKQNRWRLSHPAWTPDIKVVKTQHVVFATRTADYAYQTTVVLLRFLGILNM